MKKTLLLLLVLSMGFQTYAQSKIQLRSVNKAECVKSDMTSLQASFSFSTIEAENVDTKGGTFAWLSLPNTVIGGNEGDPQIPVVNKLIAVPVGATPIVTVTHYSTTEYNLSDYGIEKIIPRQPDIRKDQKPEDVPFVINESAYKTRGLRSEPTARVSVNGIMRGVQVGQLSIEPVSYDPVGNTLRVFNDIEVEVSFNGANTIATEELLVKTYSPYFNSLYDQLFNGRAVRDVYEDHPDLWKSPVKMLVIANRTFENCLQDWLAWKTTKGFYVDVNYTDEIGTTSSAIQSFIQSKYATDTPTFLMIMGDKDLVPASATGSETSCVTDLSYSSVDGDEFVDMFHSRFPAETVAQMTAMLNKALEYEQYTMPDPSYLNNVLLIAGEDSSGWGETVGRPTIWYATNYYYNADHGFQNVYEFSHGTYTNCYSYLSSGVGFANYTAHGSNTSWAGPSFTVSDVSNLTNEHKYFLAMGNCCQAADWGISGTSFGEAMVRAENKGAYAYIGSCPSTYWKNDYYFGVGPTSRADGTMPTMDETGTGCYDAIWNDAAYNTVNSILYIGNLAGNAAQALGYELHISTLYYWQAYHVLGDGSIMPYRVQPTANIVSHMPILPIGMNTYEVNAVPGSYVAISKDGQLYGAALVDGTGTVQVPITPITSGGDVTICVTAPNRIPYIQTVPAAALEGPYIAMDSYTPNTAHVGDDTDLSITFKNVGTDATTGTTTVTLTSDDTNVIIDNETGSFDVLAAEATTTVNGFVFHIKPGVADGTKVTMHYTAVNGSDTYEGNIVVTANEAVLTYTGMSWNGGFTPGETLTLSATFKNTGHYQATNAKIELSSESNYIQIITQSVEAGTLEVGQEVTYAFSVAITSDCPETAQIPVTFTMTADGDISATGNETLKNSCNVIFNLIDSYGDGWNGNVLTVSFDDGTPSETLTIASGSSETYTLEIGNGTHVTLTWTTGSYAYECSFSVSYEGDLMIYQSSGTPSAGVLYEFDCNCAAASITYMVTVESENTEHGTVSGGGEYSFGESCTVTATPAEGYYFTGWLQDDEVVADAGANYTFIVNADVDLVATFAEGLMIGDGGSTTDQYLPSHSYYNYTLSQQIYTTEELGNAGIISSIAFYNGGTTKTRTYDVYMVSTTKSAFSGANDWVTVTSDNLVYSGSVEMTANDWTTIVFSNPFIYDGISNVVLVVDDNTGSYSQGMLCRVFDAPSQALRIYSDGTNYNPFAPSSYSGTVMNVKNQLMVTKSALDGCVNATPTGTEVSDITSSSATVTWTGFSESYNVMLGIPTIAILVNEDFADAIPTNWTNDATYPWTIVDGYIQSGNAGVASSTSSISITATFSGDGTVEFDAECMGEGTKGVKTVWDKCIFSIDGIDQFTNGANVSGWNHYSYEVAAGEHTFTWSYTKDTSVDPDGDYFAVDNVVMKSVNTSWNDPIAVEDAEYRYTGLTPETTYCVSVQGICEGVETGWSELFLFTTDEATLYTQTLALNAGWNWFSLCVELEGPEGLNQFIDLMGDYLQTITSQKDGYMTYEDGWDGSLEGIYVDKMYQVFMNGFYNPSISAPEVHPNNHPVTINKGWNWIGYPCMNTNSVGTAFANFNPCDEDLLKSRSSFVTYYEGTGWWGSLGNLVPGSGYKYQSNSTDTKALVYNEGAKSVPLHTSDVTNLHWSANGEAFRSNANVIATIDAADIALSENIEIGAFVNNECRGSAKMLYVEPLDQYLAFISIYGDENEEILFKIYDEGNTFQAEESLQFANDMVIGKIGKPFTLHVNQSNNLVLYPNPVEKGQALTLELPSNMDLETVRVEVYNTYGSLVLSQSLDRSFYSNMASGVYTIKVIDGQGQSCHGKLIVK